MTIPESGELTHKEQRVAVYNDIDKPSDPRSIASSTPLDELNLNWSERDLPERIRTKHVHRLHPYLGKFIPQVVEIFLRKYFQPGQTVLDPFAGSGTTLVQANELGINTVGYDVSAFNVLLTRAKTKHYNLRTVRHEILDILDRTAHTTQSEVLQPSFWTEVTDSKAHREDIATGYLERWFAPQALSELLTYRDLIDAYEDKDILKVILSRSARSARLTTHFDLDFPKAPQTEPYWCYKHGRECAPTTSAFQFLKRYSSDTLQRLEEFATLQTNATVSIFHGDSRSTTIPQVDGLITSPPYVGLIDYHEQHRYAYELLQLRDCSDLEIGAARRGAGRKAQLDYQQAIADVFRHACKSMSSGGRLIVIAGDKHNLYPAIAQMVEVETEAVLHRHVNRRTGRRAGEFFESIFIWRKP